MIGHEQRHRRRLAPAHLEQPNAARPQQPPYVACQLAKGAQSIAAPVQGGTRLIFRDLRRKRVDVG